MENTTQEAKYLITDQKHETLTKGGESVFLVLKYGQPWAWLTNQQYHCFYHEGRIFPKMLVSQLA